MQESQLSDRQGRPEPFCFIFEDERFRTDERNVTPPEIREIVGGIPADIPLVLVLEDCTQRTLQEDEEIPLAPCPNLRRLPIFRRG
jgi:hypothetical protein